jgi:hypothetical protein
MRRSFRSGNVHDAAAQPQPIHGPKQVVDVMIEERAGWRSIWSNTTSADADYRSACMDGILPCSGRRATRQLNLRMKTWTAWT